MYGCMMHRGDLRLVSHPHEERIAVRSRPRRIPKLAAALRLQFRSLVR
jgi:hypothetical protein